MLLDNTLLILEELGWCQGFYADEETGGVCLVAALELALGLPLGREEYVAALPVLLPGDRLQELRQSAAALLEEWDEPVPDELWDQVLQLTALNDRDQTTFEDVVLVLKRAATRTLGADCNNLREESSVAAKGPEERSLDRPR